MSECTGPNSLIMSMKTSRVKAMGLVSDLFEELRTKLNQYKNDDMIEDEHVMPFVFGLMSEVGGTFIESTNNREAAEKAFAKLVKLYVSDVIPWNKIVNLTSHDM